jgi:hypothetical protein
MSLLLVESSKQIHALIEKKSILKLVDYFFERGMCIGYWLSSQKERDHSEDQDVGDG